MTAVHSSPTPPTPPARPRNRLSGKAATTRPTPTDAVPIAALLPALLGSIDAGLREPYWPPLDRLGLSASAIAERKAGIGGSDANTILSRNAERIVRLWREKRGEIESEDLSDRLNVMLGCWTEDFNRQWYEKITGHVVTSTGANRVCPKRSWRTATIDGFVAAKEAIWEAKHTSPFAKPDEVIERYMPQLQHNMAVSECDHALLSVIYGNAKWEVYEIASDWMYQEDLLEAEMRFWHCVQTGEPPAVCIVDHVPKPVGVREIAMTGNNRWAAAAADWLDHREAAKKHTAATTTLRELVEDDVTRAFGYGIEARRNKAGALTIRELKP